jgi:hypothetical protein
MLAVSRVSRARLLYDARRAGRLRVGVVSSASEMLASAT